MPAFEAEVGMPYWITLASSDVKASEKFYSAVLGWEFEDGIARLQGLPIAEIVPGQDTWATYFLSRDLEADCARVEQLGGKILALGAPLGACSGQQWCHVWFDAAGARPLRRRRRAGYSGVA